jgi:hypothetical protein
MSVALVEVAPLEEAVVAVILLDAVMEHVVVLDDLG